jgi:hypothetical protein
MASLDLEELAMMQLSFIQKILELTFRFLKAA